jgi:hypothetical protein
LAQKLGQNANYSLLQLYSYKNVWANLHPLDQLKTFLAYREEHQLVVTMSHTHAGPGILSRQETFTSLPGGHFIGPYLDAVVAACVDASRQAVDALEPAWIRDANSGARGAARRPSLWPPCGLSA